MGFVLAFGATALYGFLGQNPTWLWCLFTLFGIWVWQLPALKQLDPKMTLLAAYGFPFTLLWLASNPEPAGTMKTYVYQVVTAGIALASLIALGGVYSLFRKQPSLRPIILAMVPLFLCAWLIATFSSSTGASSHMVSVLTKVFGLDASGAELTAKVIRKSLHFLFYGTIGWLGYRAAVKGGAVSKAILLGIAVTAMHASFDEIRQSSYSDRTASFWDVCLDTAGATCFVMMAAGISRKSRTSRSGGNTHEARS